MDFHTLSPETQRELRDLTHKDAKFLAIGARRARDLETERSYPADPIEAVRAARKVAHEDVQVTIDDPASFALNVMEVVSAALNRGNFDDHDASAIVDLLFVAEAGLRTYKRQRDAADDRLRAITHPSK